MRLCISRAPAKLTVDAEGREHHIEGKGTQPPDDERPENHAHDAHGRLQRRESLANAFDDGHQPVGQSLEGDQLSDGGFGRLGKRHHGSRHREAGHRGDSHQGREPAHVNAAHLGVSRQARQQQSQAEEESDGERIEHPLDRDRAQGRGEAHAGETGGREGPHHFSDREAATRCSP